MTGKEQIEAAFDAKLKKLANPFTDKASSDEG